MSSLDNHQMDIATAPKRDSKTWHNGTITWGEVLGWMAEPADHKECGNYVLGALKGDRRTKSSLLHRGALTLDVDQPEEGFLADVAMLGFTVLVHTTFKSTPDVPRYRMIIPLDRDVSAAEYHVAAAGVMQQLGEQLFDPGSVQAERYMFKPSENAPGLFSWHVYGDGLAPVEELLLEWVQDYSALPAPKASRYKRDPYELEGTIGAFNRCYRDLDDLIATYHLPYESEGADRYHLAGASAASGMGPVQGAVGLYYSHHANDPAYGQTCSAFDLVRLHRFSHFDSQVASGTPVNRRPSHEKMLELASTDERVVRELVGLDFADEMADVADDVENDPTDWQLRFTLHPRTGQVTDTVDNWDLIVRHDAAFKVLYLNELSGSVEIDADLPWRPHTPQTVTFDKRDESALCLHIERQYGIRPSKQMAEQLVDELVQHRRINPVADYLRELVWDGVPRVETALPGVRPTAYTRTVARKVLVAAVARMLDPGCKWDHMLVLYGKEGLGKSFWVDKMSKGYSASMGRIGDKDTLLTLQRSWIVTSDEGHNMRKADFDAQKEFLTRREDVFRAPYDRATVAKPRHCVIWGTTNDESFLRKQEGNRRFLVVRCEEKVNFDALSDDYVDQVWAEALHLYRSGELLFLTEEESEVAAEQREEFTEENAHAGVVQAYLDMLVPPEWDDMSISSRVSWMRNVQDGFETPGTDQIDRVCSAQLWTEALGQEYGRHKRTDLLELSQIMADMPGWRKRTKTTRLGPYGPQVVYERDDVF